MLLTARHNSRKNPHTVFFEYKANGISTMHLYVDMTINGLESVNLNLKKASEQGTIIEFL